MRVTMLGCGPSWGVPRIGGIWGACDPSEPRNRRRRVSVLVEEEEGARILIDTSPDLREQLLDAGVRGLEAVLFTHAHADHLHGIDDLRMINSLMRKNLPIYGAEKTIGEIRQRFGYVFPPLKAGVRGSYYKPVLEPNVIEGPFTVAGLTVVPVRQDHGYSETLGFRLGRFAYSTDVVRLGDEAFAELAGIELWIVDCFRRVPHATHSHLAQTLAWIARLRPRRAVLTHMDESLDYRALRHELPSGVEPGYDGLVLEI